LENLVKNLDIETRVYFTGFVSNPEEYLSQSHLFVLPSHSEGFGIAVVEAMQQEMACLCSNVGGISEFITHNESGWLFNPNNEIELIEKLNNLIASPYSGIQKIAKQAKESVKNKFTIQKYVDNLENLYQNQK